MTDRLDDPMLFDFESLWGSDHVKIMTSDQMAVYMRLLSCQWREGDLPADPRFLALRASHGERHVSVVDLIGAGTLEDPATGSIWAALSPCYQNDGTWCWNARVRADREVWLKKKAMYADRARSGGEAKAKRARSLLEADLKLATKHAPYPSPDLPPDPEELGDPGADLPRAPEARARAPSKAERDFSTWWPLMPPKAKTGKAKALAAWRRLPADQREPAPVVLFLDFLRETEAEVYLKEGGQYLPHGAAFVKSRQWEDDRDSYPPESGNGHPGPEIQGAAQALRDGPGIVELYLLRRQRLDDLGKMDEADRDVDETDADLELFKSSLKAELLEINRDPGMKAELRAEMEKR